MLNRNIQQFLINHGLLDPPADGSWGPQSKAALLQFQGINGLPPNGEVTEETLTLLARAAPPQMKLGSDLASRIIREMQICGYWISRGSGRYNIVYLEGADKDGRPNNDAFNEWNDRRILIEIESDTPKIVGNWLATTEPGATYTYQPMNSLGAFRIAFGQYRSWCFGLHGQSQYPALVQCGAVKGHRDSNKDGFRSGDPIVVGDGFGINQHHGWNMQLVDEASGGCLVGQSIEGHQQFMEILRGDRRYRVNPGYVFYTTILPGDQLP